MRKRGDIRRGSPSGIGNLVGERLADMGMDAKIREHTAPLLWAEVVGPQVAGATEVIGVENGVLRVSTKSSVWASELTFYKADIVRRLNARIAAKLGASQTPPIRDLHFVNRGIQNRTEQAPPPPSRGPRPEELDDIELSAREITLIEESVASVRDETLRQRLRRVRVSDARLRTWRLDNGWAPCAQCGDLVPPYRRDDDVPCPRCRLAASPAPAQNPTLGTSFE